MILFLYCWQSDSYDFRFAKFESTVRLVSNNEPPYTAASASGLA